MCGNSGNCGPLTVCVVEFTDPQHVKGVTSPAMLAAIAEGWRAKDCPVPAYAVIDNAADVPLVLTAPQMDGFQRAMLLDTFALQAV